MNDVGLEGIRRQLLRWVPVMLQCHEAEHYIERTEALGHPHLLDTRDKWWEFLLHFRGAVNSYAKCFLSSGSGMMKLEPSKVFGGHTDLASLHERIMNLRHTYVAHSDQNDVEKPFVEIEDSPNELSVRLGMNFSFAFDRIYELRRLIRHVVGFVVDKHGRHLEKIQAAIGKTVRVEEG